MKTYKIKDDIVAAHNEEQAIGTWAAHFDEDPKTCGPVEEVDPATYEVNYEQEDGSFKPGPLADVMFDGMDPEVIIDGDSDC